MYRNSVNKPHFMYRKKIEGYRATGGYGHGCDFHLLNQTFVQFYQDRELTNSIKRIICMQPMEKHITSLISFLINLDLLKI